MCWSKLGTKNKGAGGIIFSVKEWDFDFVASKKGRPVHAFSKPPDLAEQHPWYMV